MNVVDQVFRMDEQAIFLESVNTYGEANQLEQTCEELAECLLAISKYKRAIRTNDFENLPRFMTEMEGEFADVIIMMTQMKLLFNNNTIQETITRKLNRQRNRLNAHNQNL